MDVAQVVCRNLFSGEKFEARAEIRMNRTRSVIFARLGLIAVAPKGDRLVDARELGLGRQINPISRSSNHVIETPRFTGDVRNDPAVGERHVRQRTLQMQPEPLECHDPLDRIERHRSHASISEQKVAPADGVRKLVGHLAHVRMSSVARA